jgi:hypothetical protein
MKWVPYVVGVVLCAVAVVAGAMMPSETLKGYGTIWLAADTVLIWYFTLGYGFLSRWYDDEVGAHLMVFSAAICFVFANLLYLRLAKGATAASDGLVLVTGFYIALTFIFFWRAVIFTRAQLTARKKHYA